MRRAWIFAVALLLICLSAPLSGEDSDADGPKQIVFVDGGDVYEVMYYVDGFHAPRDPNHHGVKLVGWAYDGRIIDPDTFDFDSVPDNPVILYACYEDDPVGAFADDVIFYGVLVMVGFFSLILLYFLFDSLRWFARR